MVINPSVGRTKSLGDIFPDGQQVKFKDSWNRYLNTIKEGIKIDSEMYGNDSAFILKSFDTTSPNYGMNHCNSIMGWFAFQVNVSESLCNLIHAYYSIHVFFLRKGNYISKNEYNLFLRRTYGKGKSVFGHTDVKTIDDVNKLTTKVYNRAKTDFANKDEIFQEKKLRREKEDEKERKRDIRYEAKRERTERKFKDLALTTGKPYRNAGQRRTDSFNQRYKESERKRRREKKDKLERKRRERGRSSSGRSSSRKRKPSRFVPSQRRKN